MRTMHLRLSPDEQHEERTMCLCVPYGTISGISGRTSTYESVIGLYEYLGRARNDIVRYNQGK